MTQTVQDRLYGESTSVAVKAPVAWVATSNINFPGGALPTGLFNVGAGTPAEGDRVLLMGQSNPVQNGIYNASALMWKPAGDWGGSRDIVNGTMVIVPSATGTLFLQVNGTAPIVPGFSPITFSVVTSVPLTGGIVGALLSPASAAETAAGVTPTLFNIARYKDVPVERYGVTVGTAPGTETANTAGMNQAISVAKAVSGTGGVIYMPEGTIRVNASLLTGTVGVNWQGSGKGQTFLEGVGFSLDQPVIDVNHGSGGSPTIDTIFMRDFAITSDNGLARGLSAAWIKGSEIKLYFYNLYNGAVMSTCFNNKWDINSFQVGLSTVQLLGTCDQNSFYDSRFVGYQALAILGSMDTINLFGGDIEGVIAGGGTWNGTSWSVGTTAGVGFYIVPGVGNVVQNINAYGVHWEHINGYAIAANGNVSNAIAGLNVLGCKIFGSHAADSNTYGLYAIQLINVLNHIAEGNDFGDWGTAAYQLNGTESGGRVKNNSNQGGNVSVLSNQAFQGSVQVENNFAGPPVIYGASGDYAPLYGTTVTIDRTQGDVFTLNVTNGTAFTISNPINIVKGQKFTLKIRNIAGGALGTITWSSQYKMSTWTSPASTFSRSITFEYDGTNCIQLSQTGVDVPN